MGSFSFPRARRFSTSSVKKTDSKELVPSKLPPVGAHKDEAPEPNVKVIKPPNFSPGQKCVTVITGYGNRRDKFLIHKEFACYHSPVFRAAFNSRSNFVESQTDTYRMKDTDGEVMQLLMQWLYTQKLGLAPYSKDPATSTKICRQNMSLALRLWVLGDMLIIPKLQNDVSDYIWAVQDTSRIAWTPHIRYVYERTVPGSPLRRLFVMFCARYIGKPFYVENAKQFPHEMLLELADYFTRYSYHIASNIQGEGKEKFHIEVRRLS